MKPLIKNIFKSNSTEIFLLLHSMKHFSPLSSQYKLAISKQFVIHSYNAMDIIHKQNSPITDIYIVKKGTFSLTYTRKTDSPVDFNLDYFLNYQNISNERFTNNRKYELEGKLSYIEEEKIVILGEGEIIGDIEWALGKENYIFNLKANEQGSQLISCNIEKFSQMIGKIANHFKAIVKTKIESLNNRIINYFKGKKMHQINKKKSYENAIIKQFDVTHEHRLKQRAASAYFPKKKKTIEEKTQNPKDSLFFLSNNNLRTGTKYNTVHFKKMVHAQSPTSKLLQYILASKHNKIVKSKSIANMLVSIGNSRNKGKSFLTSDIKPKRLDSKNRIIKGKMNSSAPIIDEVYKREVKQPKIYFKTKGQLRLKYNANIIEENTPKINNEKIKINNAVPLDKRIFLNQEKVNVLLSSKYKFLRQSSQEQLI